MQISVGESSKVTNMSPILICPVATNNRSCMYESGPSSHHRCSNGADAANDDIDLDVGNDHLTHCHFKELYERRGMCIVFF